MLDFNDLIGLPLEKAKEKLKSNNLSYEIIESNSQMKNFDTLLVVQVNVNQNKIVLVVDKFLLNI